MQSIILDQISSEARSEAGNFLPKKQTPIADKLNALAGLDSMTKGGLVVAFSLGDVFKESQPAIECGLEHHGIDITESSIVFNGLGLQLEKPYRGRVSMTYEHKESPNRAGFTIGKPGLLSYELTTDGSRLGITRISCNVGDIEQIITLPKVNL